MSSIYNITPQTSNVQASLQKSRKKDSPPIRLRLIGATESSEGRTLSFAEEKGIGAGIVDVPILFGIMFFAGYDASVNIF